MPFDALQGREPRGGAASLQRLGHGPLLRYGKEKIGLHPDDQRLLQPGLAQHGHGVAVGAEIEAVHRP